ncbi:DNA cytosine methyltransferase [Paraburkholderia phenoliruptrix]|uniref:DNA cytosine methyltransferase n=1 Tax=Paraburkholderia phenoliruptrix TaxID=252970 RepID=UPI0034CE3BB9
MGGKLMMSPLFSGEDSSLEYGSVCSGIEAATAAWEDLGWRPAWLAEIEKFPSDVLEQRVPGVPNLGDMTTIAAQIIAGSVVAPDVLVGGTPCQAFSVAGMRKGLSDARGQLTLSYVQLANAIDTARSFRGKLPAILLWENVPGVLSSNDNAFGCFLGALAGEDCALEPPGRKWSNAGYVLGPQRAVAWRVLDAQYFGVAQRRRRVFVVASAREGFDPREVLFESDGVRRDTAPRRETGEETAGTLASRTGAGGFPGTDEACSGYLQPVGGRVQVSELRGDECSDVVADVRMVRPRDGVLAYGGGRVSGPLDVAACLTAKGQRIDFEVETFAVSVFDPLQVTSPTNRSKPTPDLCHTLPKKAEPPIAFGSGIQWRVRRLMPVECERLQGFPDGWTAIVRKGKEAADGPRYKALGNSMAVTCMAWLGRRIKRELSK